MRLCGAPLPTVNVLYSGSYSITAVVTERPPSSTCEGAADIGANLTDEMFQVQLLLVSVLQHAVQPPTLYACSANTPGNALFCARRTCAARPLQLRPGACKAARAT